MALLQLIPFHAGQGYVAGFLQQLIQESGLNASVTFDGKTIRLLMDESDPALLEHFGQLVASDLPYSLFMGTIETRNSDEPIIDQPFQPEPALLPLCPRCLRTLFDKNSPGYLREDLVCTHYGAKPMPQPAEAADFNVLADELLEGHSVRIGKRDYSLTYRPGDTLLLTNPSAAGHLFLLSQEEIKALFSIEKPLLKLAMQDESLKEETGKSVIKAGLFDDAPSAILSQLINRKGKNHLFVKREEAMEVMINKSRLHILHPGKLGDRPKPQDDDPVTNLFLNVTEEFGIRDISSIGGYLNKTLEWQFIHRSAKVNKPVIRFAPFESNGIVSRLVASSGARARLMENFKSAFPGRYEALQTLATQEGEELFEAVGAILGIAGGYEAVSDASLGFAGNGGVKVDVHFKEGNFDHLSFLASLISFKLAGVEKHLLAYSLFESLADLATDTLTQLKSRLKSSETVLLGGMMSNTPFYSRIQRNMGNTSPHISNRYPLDV